MRTTVNTDGTNVNVRAVSHENHKCCWKALAACAAAVLGSATATAQDPAPISVLTFDREFVNWASAQERSFDFPDAAVPIRAITMTIRLDCPSGGCDPWDRSAFVFVRGRDPAGKMDEYEIARFITPYGVGCSWEVDVTDYRIFLAGSASLGFFVETYIGGERGWLVTIRFDFYPGAPERKVLSIENLWHGKPVYGDPGSPIADFFTAKTLKIDPAATAVKLRFSVTGHGQGNTDNAAEFARKLHGVHVNADSFEHYLWRDDCDENPCSPQAGTWQFARAGWCPGSAVEPWDVDASDSVVPGGTATIQYEVEPYTNRCRPSGTCTAADCIWGDCNYNSGDHTPPIYWVESQVITYGSRLGGGSYFTFQQGLDGYTGASDTMLIEADPGADRSAATEIGIDGDDPSGSGKDTQVLLRFDGIFGEGESRIAPGTPIRKAILRLATANSGTGASIHRMLASWDEAAGWSAHGAGGVQAGIEALAEADVVAGALAGGTVEVDVTASLEAWSANPCLNHGWAFLPIGDDGWDFDSSEGDEPPSLIVETRPIAGDPLIVAGDEWQYFKGTQAPPAGWNQRGFVPGAGWLAGPTGIGYADDDDATVLDDMAGQYPSVFCRREFQVGPFVSALRLEILYDDGFAAFVNGVEFARSASLAAPGAQLRWNMLAVGSHEADESEVHEIPVSSLVPGTNVLAIQVHNNALDSSDLSMIPWLTADYALVAPGAEWRFLRGSTPLPAGWKDPAFDDSAWEEGPTGIGYGDGDDVTRLVDMEDSYAAVFCRKAFDIDGLEGLEAVSMRVAYDDGIVLFVNGTEVQRLNMPGGTVSSGLFALSAVEPTLATVPIPIGLLVEGRNVIAVSVHNSAVDSSDLSFDPVVFEARRAGSLGCDSTFRRGDCSDDGRVDISDAVFVLGSLFLGQGKPACDDACDSNDDGTVNISDPIMTLGHLFLGQGPIPPPGINACGVDPTADALACQGTSQCQ
jgi:hypothetical protein